MATYGQLTVSLGGQVLMVSALTRPTYTIGRLPNNDLPLPHSTVSPHHAEIRLESWGVVLTDLESVGGTIVDGATLMPLQPSVLRDGAAIAIGPYAISFRSQIPKTEKSSEDSGKLRPVPVHFPGMVKRSRADQSARLDGNHKTAGYLQYLPVIFHESDFLSRYLQIFEAIWEPLEQRQDHIAMYLDPRTCPASLLPWFASWFGLTIDPHWPQTRTRALLSEAIELYRWRGTKYGLTRMIEVCTGVKSEITDDPSRPFVFRIRVHLPANNEAIVGQLVELIEAHKPAHAGYFLEVQ